MAKHDDDLTLKARPVIPIVGPNGVQGSDPMHEQMIADAIYAMSQRILELEAINAALLAACEGMLRHIDDVLDDKDLMKRRASLVTAIKAAKGGA